MEETGLVHFTQARQALRKAKTIDEVIQIRDAAERMRVALRQAKEAPEMVNDAVEIKVRAERRAGEMLIEGAKNGDRQKAGDATKYLHRASIKEQVEDATTIPPSLKEIGISHTQSHRWQMLAEIPEEVFEETIQESKEKAVPDLSTQALLRTAKEQKREEKREQNRELVATAPPAVITAADTRYQTIVIDPPWDWGDEGDVDQFGRGRPTYATMTFEEVAALPVGDLAEKNAHIYLWITNRSLPKGFLLLEEWGFRYVTALTWCKPSIGMGNYFRGSSEHVLFGVKGSLSLLRNNVGTWFAAPRPGRHSAKPPEFFHLVEECSPGPWLEMFARNARPGWVSWGAEV